MTNYFNLRRLPARQTLITLALTFCLLIFPLESAKANTIVRVTTPVGDFSIELFDDIAPGTVNNFLNYVNAGRYDGTVIHRSEPGFVIQGGWLTFDESANQFFAIATDPAIDNEFNFSNLRGTVAMAKLPQDPDSATSQWFVNLADNSFLDNQNGGFTVFGRVLDDGMEVVDAIAELPTALLVSGSPFPTIDLTGSTVTNANLVSVEMSVLNALTQAANAFDESTGLLNVKLDAGALGLAALSFEITATEPQLVIQALLSSVEVLNDTVENMATFDEVDGRLVLPELVVNGAVAFRNVVFLLSDAEQLLFTLQSFE